MSTDVNRSLSERLLEVADSLAEESERLKEFPAELERVVGEMRTDIESGAESERIARETALAEISARLGGAIFEFRDADKAQAERIASQLGLISAELREADSLESEGRRAGDAASTAQISAVSQRMDAAVGELREA